MICYLTPTPPRLSETFITDELAVLRAHGLAVQLVPLHSGGAAATAVPLRTRLGAWARLAAARWHRLPAWLLAAARLRGTPRWVLLRSLDLAAAWRRQRPQRVHVHFADQTASAAVLAARLVPVPVSITAHARDIFDPPARRFAAFARYRAWIVAVCRYNRTQLAQLGFPLERMAVIPCGVVGTAADVEPSRYAGCLRILVVGRLVEKKGIDDLLHAAAGPEFAGQLEGIRIIGDGPERERLERLAEVARRAGVPVALLGALERGEHAEHQRWANVFCLPCKIATDGDRDSMPVAIKEALLAGLPVISTTAVGIPEMVDERCAILVPPGDAVALGLALQRFARLSADERAALACAGQARMVERFSAQATAGAMCAFLLDGVRPATWELPQEQGR